ncbi:integral membrane family protein [Phlyctema vagabunda]|uniref:Integral membrane family protein n=1 Tax=Phlyctema vagabunda TaxID=108571 RepID=A0ABR4PQU0_9HELO
MMFAFPSLFKAYLSIRRSKIRKLPVSTMTGTAHDPPDINRGPQILAICGTLVGLTIVTILLRLWVRIKIIRQLGWDDYFMVAAMAILFVEMMIFIPQVHYGAGRHVKYIVPASNVTKGLHLNFVTQPLCVIALCLAKVSIGLFLFRLTPSHRYSVFILCLITLTVLSATGNLLTVFFQCRPLAFTWDATVPGGKCIPPANLKFAAFFNSSVSVLTDLIFALLPIPMLWNVQLNWKVKSAVAGILSLGIFATAAAFVKIFYLTSYGKHGDFLFDSSDLTIWTTVEICTAMMAASIPCLKPLFRAIFTGSSAANYGSQGYNNNQGYVRNADTNKTHTAHRPNWSGKNSADDEADFELHRRNMNTTEITAPSSVSDRAKMDLDNVSEESILPLGGNLSPDGIMKTLQISVSTDEYHQKSPKDLV